MKNKFLFLTIFISLIIISLMSCTTTIVEKTDEDKDPTYTLSGILNSSGENGKTAYLKLVSEGEYYTSTALHKTSAVFSGDDAAYSKSGIVADDYTAWVFIDMNGNANVSDPLPDTNDLYASVVLNITGNQTQNVSVWNTFTGYSLSGTLTRSSANGRTAYLKLVEDGGAYTDTMLYAATAVFSGGSAAYSVSCEVSGGNYTAWVFIDMNGNANASSPAPDTGDLYATININITSNTIQDVAEGAWLTY